MVRSTLLGVAPALAAVLAVTVPAGLPPARTLLGLACAAGLALLRLHRRRSLLELA